MFSYVSYRKGNKIETQRVYQDHAEKIAELDSRLRLRKVFADGKGKFLYVSNKQMVLFNKNKKNENITAIESPFDINSAIFSQDSKQIYILEGFGSEVAILDFNSKKLTARTSTGRVGVKIAKIFAATTTFGLYNGYYSFLLDQSYLMAIDRKYKTLYVANDKTNDVTILNATDFSKKNIVATGNDTLSVFRLNKKYFPQAKDGNIIVLSLNKISYFNSENTNQPYNQFEFREIVAIDSEENFIFVKKKKNIAVYQLSTGQFIALLPNTNNAHDFYSYPDIRHDVFL